MKVNDAFRPLSSTPGRSQNREPATTTHGKSSLGLSPLVQSKSKLYSSLNSFIKPIIGSTRIDKAYMASHRDSSEVKVCL
jgi:hypothetical protein